ncbi:MAG: CotH kinase family protein [Bacteroidales bacterium]|nr:CotH kinase family protein [Bacteroidales bacterium]
MTHFRLIILTIVLMGLSSCYKEVELPINIGEVFELSVTPEMQEFIYNSRDTSYTIEEPGMAFLLDDQPLALDEIRTRGKSALRFQRKSFTVILNEPISISGGNGSERKLLTRFKLIAMAMDYTYIENRIGFGILEKQEIMPLFYRYVELKINGATQGIYLLVEDPEKYYMECGSEFILRRGYYNSIVDAEYAPSFHFIPRESYETRFREIYANLTLLQGEALYDALNQRLDLEQYFRKMGIDYLLQNGDYTDEIYFYALIRQDQIRFSIIPWDYDDLFRNYPHEVGITWGTGKLFGDRYYGSHQDILDEIGEKMIFSIEDDLDYAIAMDPFLYTRYESCLAGMVEKMNPEDFDDLFAQVKKELTPFYTDEEMVSQSQYDQHETTIELWERNMEEKKAFLKERLGNMKEELRKIQQ